MRQFYRVSVRRHVSKTVGRSVRPHTRALIALEEVVPRARAVGVRRLVRKVGGAVVDSSKCEVSTSDAIDGTCGGSSDRATRRSKSIDAKNGWSMMYLRPKLLVGRLADAGRLYTVQGEWDL